MADGVFDFYNQIDRYYGESSPVDVLTPKTMQHLTFKNALADTVYFAQTVELPFDGSDKSSPKNAVCATRLPHQLFIY